MTFLSFLVINNTPANPNPNKTHRFAEDEAMGELRTEKRREGEGEADNTVTRPTPKPRLLTVPGAGGRWFCFVFYETGRAYYFTSGVSLPNPSPNLLSFYMFPNFSIVCILSRIIFWFLGKMQCNNENLQNCPS